MGSFVLMERNLTKQAFPQTRWSLVMSAGDDESCEELCRIYWRPIYGFLRKSGHARENAEDLTQSFFARVLKDGSFLSAEKEKGRLRSFLLGALKRHVIDFRRAEGRVKRGSGVEHFSLATSELDFDDAENYYASQPVEEQTPDKVFDQAWLLALLARTHERIAKDYRKAGRELEYLLLKEGLVTAGEIDRKDVSEKLKVAPATVGVLLHRLRQNFRGAMRDEIAETVGSRAEVDEELAYLMNVFS